MSKNDQCSHCSARKKDNGVTCPQYVQNIRTLCSLPARSGNVHYIFFNSLFNGFIKTTKKEKKKKKGNSSSSSSRSCGAAGHGAGFWRITNYAQTGSGLPVGRLLSSFLAASSVTYVPASVCHTPAARGVSSADGSKESVCLFSVGGGVVLPFHFEDVCN